jgi:ribosome-binding protein aMBF1 (putative translation factor)
MRESTIKPITGGLSQQYILARKTQSKKSVIGTIESKKVTYNGGVK